MATSFVAQTSFLHDGPHAVQRGVARGAIAPARQAVVRGRAVYRGSPTPLQKGEPAEGAALPGVRVSVRGRPELGWTLTRADGWFDLVVNGGEPVVLEIRSPDFLPVHRRAKPSYHAFANLGDVAMTPRDLTKTRVTPGAASFQVVRSTVVRERRATSGLVPQRAAAPSVSGRDPGDMSRSVTMLVPPGTTSKDLPARSWSMRATEYTIGANGRRAMPAELPPNSGYTYAVELSIDEAEDLGRDTVRFNQPLPVYVDNFLGLRVGAPVPSGWYDRAREVWVGERSGRVVDIVGTAGGIAHVDVDGDGREDAGPALEALGITDDERRTLAATYPEAAHKSVWRIPVAHFTIWDWNMPLIPPEPPPVPPTPDPPKPAPKPPCCKEGKCDPCEQKNASTIEAQNQILKESLPLLGTPYTLDYASDRAAGHKAYLHVPLPPPPSNVVAQKIKVEIAGVTNEVELPPSQTSYDFTWDRRDAYGRELQGTFDAAVTAGYTYQCTYGEAAFWAEMGTAPLGIDWAREQVTLANIYHAPMGGLDAKPFGLGGLSLSAHHVYQPDTATLHLGDGSRRYIGDVHHVQLFAGGGTNHGDDVPALQALTAPGACVFGSDGLYFADTTDAYVRRVGTDDLVRTVAGGNTVDGGDGESALLAAFNAGGLAFGHDGAMYIADPVQNRVRRVQNGTITAFAGHVGGGMGFSGDGGPAVDATFRGVVDVAVGPDGVVYIADVNNQVVRKVSTNGTISTFAGTPNQQGHGGDGGPATSALLGAPTYLAVGPDGSVYITDTFARRIRKVDTFGIITTFAGGGPYSPQLHWGDGGPATQAYLQGPGRLAVQPDGTVFVFDLDTIRAVDQHGTINTFAGQDPAGPSTTESARAARFDARGLAIGPDGALYTCDNARIRRIRALIPEAVSGYFSIPNGGEILVFDAEGRHRATKEARTGALLAQFGYDGEGRLTNVTNGDGLVTQLSRDASGVVTGIVAPFGHTTLLGVDANGYLSSVTNPNAEQTTLVHDALGLLLGLRDPKVTSAYPSMDWHRFEWDTGGLGRLVKDMDPAGGSFTLAKTWDADGYGVSLTSQMGRARTMAVHTLSTGEEESRVTGASGSQYVYRNDRANGVSTTTHPDGTVVVSGPVPDGQYGLLFPGSEESTTTPGGLVRYTRSSRAATMSSGPGVPALLTETVTTLTNPPDCALGAACTGMVQWTTAYDAAARTVTTTSPMGRVSTTSLDARGRTTGWSMPGVLGTGIHYDTAGRVDQTAQGTRIDTTAYSGTTGWRRRSRTRSDG